MLFSTYVPAMQSVRSRFMDRDRLDICKPEGFTIRNRGEKVELHGKSQVILLNNPNDLQKGTEKK